MKGETKIRNVTISDWITSFSAAQKAKASSEIRKQTCSSDGNSH